MDSTALFTALRPPPNCSLCFCQTAGIFKKKTRATRPRKDSLNTPLPLSTAQDGVDTLHLLRPVSFGKRVGLNEHLAFRYHPTGHILGARSLEIEACQIRLWSSGDLGRYRDEVMNPPGAGNTADYIFVESTDGNRLYSDKDISVELAEIINRTAARDGVVLIPAFAIGRTQTMLITSAVWKMRDAFRACRFSSTARWPSMHRRSTASSVTRRI